MTEIQKKSASEILVEALQLFGPEGEHWCKGMLENNGSYCLLGAALKVSTGNSAGYYAGNQVALERAASNLMRQLPKPEPGFFPIGFNNAPETTFADIKRVMCGAIKECLAQEEQADGST